MPEQEEGAHGVSAEGERGSCGGEAPALYKGSMCSEAWDIGHSNPEKVEGSVLSSPVLRSWVLTEPGGPNLALYPFWSLWLPQC